jgi:hypothetical protein
VLDDISATQAVLGSPLYMSPEQLASARSEDAGSDLLGSCASAHEVNWGGLAYANTDPCFGGRPWRNEAPSRFTAGGA